MQAISAKWDVYDSFAECSYLELSAAHLSVLFASILGRTKWTVPMFMQFV
jgi:hypothetical protein